MSSKRCKKQDRCKYQYQHSLENKSKDQSKDQSPTFENEVAMMHKKLYDLEYKMSQLTTCAYNAYINKDVIEYRLCMKDFQKIEKEFYGRLPESVISEDEAESNRRNKIVCLILAKFEKMKESHRSQIEDLMKDYMDQGLSALKNGDMDQYNEAMDAFESEVENYADFPNDDEFDKCDGTVKEKPCCSDMLCYIDALRHDHDIKKRNYVRPRSLTL